MKPKTNRYPLHLFQGIWQISLFSFILAGLTGFLYRYGMLFPLPEPFQLVNIRHAHSHLMFFNWVCPPVFTIMSVKLIQKNPDISLRPLRRCLYGILITGFLSYPFFLFSGYHNVPVGPAALPLAAILSGLVMMMWYYFGWIYYKNAGEHAQSPSDSFYSAAMTALWVSSLGAWGVSVFQFTSVESPLIAPALTHFFLAVFTEGWGVLGLLGMIWHYLEKEREESVSVRIHTRHWLPILTGSMLVFPFSLPQGMIPPVMLISAYTGLVLVATGLLLNLFDFVRYGLGDTFIWRIVIAVLAFKAFFQLAALLPTDIWPGEHGLRIFYLHLLLLGGFSIVAVETFGLFSTPESRRLFAISVLAVLTTLVLISGYWPSEWSLPGTYVWVLSASILPVISAVWLFIQSCNREIPGEKG